MNVVVLAAYSLAVALVLASSAWLLERALTSLHLPVRWVWVAALGLSVWLPLAAFVSAPREGASAGPVGVSAIGAPVLQTAEMEVTSEGRWDGAGTVLDLLVELQTAASRALASGVALLPAVGLGVAWVAGAWGAASILVAMILVASVLRLNRRARRWPDERLLGHDVKVSPDLGPATVGLLTPLIVIPGWAKELPPHELELVLRHEGEHVRSRDTLLLALALVAVVGCPWNPIVWWQVRRLKAAVEVDCDRRVLRNGVSPARYGDLLLRVGSRGRVTSLAVPTIAGSSSLLERRLTVMKTLQGRISVRGALPATALALLLIVVACTTEAPVATDPQAASGAAPVTNGVDPSEPRDELVATVWVDRDGTVQVNGVAHPLDRVAEVVAPLYTANAVVSLEAHETAPYQSVAALQEELSDAGFLRVVFTRVESVARRSPPRDVSTLREAGLAVVLPDATLPRMSEIEISPRNLLFVEVLPSGEVEVRRGEDPAAQRMRPRDIEGVCRHGKSLNPNLIVIVRTQPDAEYRHMYDVLDAIQRAECTRFSLQVAE